MLSSYEESRKEPDLMVWPGDPASSFTHYGGRMVRILFRISSGTWDFGLTGRRWYMSIWKPGNPGHWTRLEDPSRHGCEAPMAHLQRDSWFVCFSLGCSHIILVAMLGDKSCRMMLCYQWMVWWRPSSTLSIFFFFLFIYGKPPLQQTGIKRVADQRNNQDRWQSEVNNLKEMCYMKNWVL